MKFDIAIIGAGLAGLTAGVSLAAKGLRVAILSKGGSTLHFNSGSLGLLGFDANHDELTSPADGLSQLADAHPYSLIGNQFSDLCRDAVSLLDDADIATYTLGDKNHHRLSPLGIVRPAWLTVNGMLTLEQLQATGAKKVTVAGLNGYLNFSPAFYAAGLRKAGYETSVKMLDQIDAPSINDAVRDCDAIVVPAVAPSGDFTAWQNQPAQVDKPMFYASTMGVSVPGLMIERQLTRRFAALGGVVIKTDGTMPADCVADTYIYAPGRYFSRGLTMLPDTIEAVGNLDVDTSADGRFARDMFAPQPYMTSGIKVDSHFRAMRSGKVLNDVYAVGSALAGADSLQEDSGAGVAMLTALYVSNQIAKNG